jgi:hypothetical protein
LPKKEACFSGRVWRAVSPWASLTVESSLQPDDRWWHRVIAFHRVFAFVLALFLLSVLFVSSG